VRAQTAQQSSLGPTGQGLWEKIGAAGVEMHISFRFHRPFDTRPPISHITFMALSKKKATTIALDPEDDRLLTRAARERGVSRSEFIRQQLTLVLEQYRRHPKPATAGMLKSLPERGDEDELFGGRR
jgi:hypothetical protein